MTRDVGGIDACGWVGATDWQCARLAAQKAALLRIAISGHVEVFSNKQQSLDVGSCLRALQGEEVRDVHIG